MSPALQIVVIFGFLIAPEPSQAARRALVVGISADGASPHGKLYVPKTDQRLSMQDMVAERSMP